MIEIENVKKVFDVYVSNFNPKDGRIKLKIDHIKRVATYCKEIAENVGLEEEKIRLAELIGYFHDIGRFMQAKNFKTFSDKESGVNHAEYSIKVLYSDGLIKDFNVDSQYDKIIKVAVLNHNKSAIEEGLNKEELLFAKIIRDADKLDILSNVITEYDFESIFWYSKFDCEKINDDIIRNFKENHILNYSEIKNNADQILAFFAYVFDFNFKYTAQKVINNKCLEIFTNRVYEHFCSDEVKKQTREIFEFSDKYLKEIF